MLPKLRSAKGEWNHRHCNHAEDTYTEDQPVGRQLPVSRLNGRTSVSLHEEGPTNLVNGWRSRPGILANARAKRQEKFGTHAFENAISRTAFRFALSCSMEAPTYSHIPTPTHYTTHMHVIYCITHTLPIIYSSHKYIHTPSRDWPTGASPNLLTGFLRHSDRFLYTSSKPSSDKTDCKFFRNEILSLALI